MSVIRSDSLLRDEYNKEPVFYCTKCLSLKIRSVPYMTDSDYCDECGSTHVEQTQIEDWEQMYENRYGCKFLNKSY